MSEQIERAAKVLAAHLPKRAHPDVAVEQAAALAEVGLLVAPHAQGALLAQREAIVARLEDAALDVLSKQGDEGAALVAAVLRQAAEIARWAHPQEADR